MIPEKIQQILSLMHSPEEWRTLKDRPRPYCFEIENGDQYLYYFGANHSRDINDEQYKKLEAYWKLFMGKARDIEKVVLVEGGLRKVWESKEMAVAKDSEAGFITLLASNDGVEILCPEPDSKDERDYLLQKFPKEYIQYYYFARFIPLWHRKLEPKESFKDFMEGYLLRNKMNHSGKGEKYDFSLEDMKMVHKSLFGSEFDESDLDFFQSIVNPMKEGAVINKVARECSMFRNVHIVSKIEDLWKEGKSMFVVFGAGHALIQEPALKSLLS